MVTNRLKRCGNIGVDMLDEESRIGRQSVLDATGPKGRPRSVSLLIFGLAMALAFPLGLIAPTAAQARIYNSDFLKKAKVKSLRNGTGHWTASTNKLERPLGAKPARCRSDKPLGSYKEARIRWYFGDAPRLTNLDSASVNTKIFKYRTRKAAKRALRKLRNYAAACPRTTEWWCTQCDGISVSYRKPVTLPNMPRRSTAWRLRYKSIEWGKGYVVATRGGRTIVLTTSTNDRVPGGPGQLSYPRSPSKASTVKLAKAAIRKAT
jgi:hypothetical protein